MEKCHIVSKEASPEGPHYTKVDFAVPFGFDRSLCSELGNTRQRNQTNIGWNFIEFVIK